MYYANPQSRVYLRFYASDIQLMADLDAAYLVLPEIYSCIAGHFRSAKN